ncbi:hypothetical protein A3Q56_02005 [Intoshia linei]|uniref:EGF-like domain-containing protein n=1 Tax=Intoshia linei TaxID=1819745 RepID=A0A177B7E0_9BILA|nr:hypothetical protein A3Q56_02005 [Intoshia linei]
MCDINESRNSSLYHPLKNAPATSISAERSFSLLNKLLTKKSKFFSTKYMPISKSPIILIDSKKDQFRYIKNTFSLNIFLVMFILSYIMEYWRMYCVNKAEKLAIMSNNYCLSNNAFMSFFGKFFYDGDCKEYFKAIYVGPFFEINPIMVLISLILRTIFLPIKHITLDIIDIFMEIVNYLPLISLQMWHFGQQLLFGSDSSIQKYLYSIKNKTVSGVTTCSIANCDACSNPNLMSLKCHKNFYYDNSTYACKTCGSSCTECTLKDSCKKCSTGYFFDSVGKACSSCLPKCGICANKLTCDTCVSSNYRVVNGIKCFSCSSYCTKCVSPTWCTSCMDGYYLDSNMCIVCPSSCLICSATKSCTTCTKDYYWDSISNTCKSCGVYCISGFCDQSSGCTKCISGYLIDNKTCRKCVPLSAINCSGCVTATFGHFWTSNVCTQCMANCASCSSAITCGGSSADTCLADFAFDSAATTCNACSSYSTSPASLTTSASCHKCKGLYFVASCSACDSTTLLTTLTPCERCADSTGSYALSGVFINSQQCKTYDCATYATILPTNINECNVCDGYYWSGGACTAPTAGNDCLNTLASTVEAYSQTVCEACENRIWFLNHNTCTAVDCTTTTTWDATKAKHCGHVWDAGASLCIPIDCNDIVSLSTPALCNACLNRYWDPAGSGTCTFINCYTATLDTQEKCNGCKFLGHYWSTTCQMHSIPLNIIINYSAECTVNTAQNDCANCEGWFWNTVPATPVCAQITCGNPTTQPICESCYGSFWNTVPATPLFETISCIAASGALSNNECYGLTDGVTSFIGVRPITAASLIKINVVNRILADYQWINSAAVVDSTCAVVSYPYTDTCTCQVKIITVVPRCEVITANDITAINALVNVELKQATTNRYAALRKSIYYDTVNNVAVASGCATPGSITTIIECQSCPATNWDTTVSSANKCKATICGIQPLDDAEKCNGCPSKIFISLNTDCYTCPPNSVSCTVSGATCAIGYVWDRDTWTCISADCSTGANQINCNQCFKWVWDTTCKACGTNCDVCSSATVCTTCSKDYIWDSTESACVLCYSTDVAICDQCSTTSIGKYFDATNILCLPCAALTLATITTAEICTRCGIIIGTKPTFWDDTATVKCATCITNCDSCSDAIGCNTCTGARFFVAGAGSSAGSCDNCMTKCATCGDALTCSKCNDGTYYVTGATNSCTDCPTDCLLCSAPNSCTTCKTNKYSDPTSGACGACIANCLTCDTSTICIKCNVGYFKNTATAILTCDSCPLNCDVCESATVCLKCSSGNCLNQNKLCTATSNNCLTCTVDSGVPAVVTCIDCIPKHELEVCLGCSSHCTECVDDKTCTVCAKTYFLDVAKCTKCPTNCKACTAADNCSECHNINMFYDKAANECKICDSNCISCLDGTKCATCGSNYFLNADKCSSCPPKCKKCAAADTCSECKDTNFLFDAVSKSCKDCGKYCKTCLTPTTCEICKATAYMDTVEKPPICKDCHTVISNCIACNLTVTNIVLCSDCHTGYTLKDDKTACLKCGAGTKICIDPLPKCDTCAATFIPSVANLTCGVKSCYVCDAAKGENCTTGNMNFTLAGCAGDCMTFSDETNKTVKRTCSPILCNPSNKNTQFCKGVGANHNCESCCETDKCNLGDISVSFQIKATFVAILTVLALMFIYLLLVSISVVISSGNENSTSPKNDTLGHSFKNKDDVNNKKQKWIYDSCNTFQEHTEGACMQTCGSLKIKVTNYYSYLGSFNEGKIYTLKAESTKTYKDCDYLTYSVSNEYFYKLSVRLHFKRTKEHVLLSDAKMILYSKEKSIGIELDLSKALFFSDSKIGNNYLCHKENTDLIKVFRRNPFYITTVDLVVSSIKIITGGRYTMNNLDIRCKGHSRIGGNK